MSFWRQLKAGLRVLTNRNAADQDLADEVQDYLAEATAALVAQGVDPAEARRAARLELGSATTLREEVRSYGWENVVGTLIEDVRYGTRQLRNHPGFTAAAVLTLALGIGACTAIFSIVNPILFEPLPYPDAGRIMMIWDREPDASRVPVTFGTYRELSERSRSFNSMAVMKPWQPTMTGPGQPERLEGQRISAAYFHMLGVSPFLGRNFQKSEDYPNGPRVVILSNTAWRQLFHADRSIVGREIKLDDTFYTVVGIMSDTFENVLAPEAQLWAPLQYDTGALSSFDTREWGHHLRMVGRLRPGVSADQARRELEVIARTPLPQFSRPAWASLDQGLIVDSLQHDITSGVRPALVAILGAVLLLLAIASVNVTNLLLARGSQRRGEFAMRAALGAGPARLVRQLLTESLLLAALASVVAIWLAQLGIKALVALSPPGLPRVSAIEVNITVFVFALGLTGLIGLAVGLIPALHASRNNLGIALHGSSRRTAGGYQMTRRSLVIAEVALALVLLITSGLLLRSLQRLFAVEPGFDPSHLLTMEVQTSGRRFDANTTHRFFSRALEAVRRVPGVAVAGFTAQLPLSGDLDVYGVQFEAQANNLEDQGAFRYAVTPGYLEAMRIPLRRGRLLDQHDMDGEPAAVLINESFAKRKFSGQDPIGHRIHIGPTEGPWYTIVGVVGDVRQVSLALAPADAVYIPITKWTWADAVLSLAVRTRGDAAALAPAIRNAIWSVDKDQPIVRVATMQKLLDASAAERRFVLILFEVFALVALVLAAVGIYGVLSGNVTERTREIGVRAALGASPDAIVRLIMRQGLTLAAIGVLIGVTGSIVASNALVTLLFGISRLDPITYLGVIAVLGLVSTIACGIPAWRAAQVDPSITLRAE